jgi:hypothetical protein
MRAWTPTLGGKKHLLLSLSLPDSLELQNVMRELECKIPLFAKTKWHWDWEKETGSKIEVSTSISVLSGIAPMRIRSGTWEGAGPEGVASFSTIADIIIIL